MCGQLKGKAVKEMLKLMKRLEALEEKGDERR